MGPAAALLLIAIALLSLVGCGGGGEDSSTSTASGSPSTATTPHAGSRQEQKERGGGHAQKKQKPQGIAPDDPTSLPNEGSKDVAPGVPTTRGGDNSIQSYGVEGQSDERVEAATTVQAYLDALVAGRWADACSLLAAKIKTNLEALLERAPKDAQLKGCPDAVRVVMGKVPKGPLRIVADVHVLSLRVEGDRGFLIYEDGEGHADEIPLEREDDRWKARAIVAKDLIVR
jgi:hypothetical protein